MAAWPSLRCTSRVQPQYCRPTLRGVEHPVRLAIPHREDELPTRQRSGPGPGADVFPRDFFSLRIFGYGTHNS